MAPELAATALILASALLHATLNAVFKAHRDRIILWAVTGMVGAVVSLPAVLYLPAPSAELWPYLGVAVIAHVAYQLSIVASYRYGALSFAYPISRGIGPALVALAAFLLLDEDLGLGDAIGIAAISTGAIMVGLATGAGAPKERAHAALFTILTGISIATYTTLDGVAVKIAQSATVYIFWLFLLHGSLTAIMIGIARRDDYWVALRSSGARGLLVAVMALTGYALALFAFRLSSIAEIAALRETSIFFAAIIAVLFLKERLTNLGRAGVLAIAVGAALLRI